MYYDIHSIIQGDVFHEFLSLEYAHE